MARRPALHQVSLSRRVRLVCELKPAAVSWCGVMRWPGRSGKFIELWNLRQDVLLGFAGSGSVVLHRAGSTVSAVTLRKLGLVPVPVIA